MHSIFLNIGGFVLSALLIIFSGARLSKYGDIIAELTGMGKAWFGLIMMSAVTSLPELFTGISSVLIVNSPDLAIGDIMGSCAFNFLILAILDYFIPGKPISSVVTKSHVLAGFFIIILVTLSVISIVFGHKIPVIGWFSSSSIVLVLFYLVAIRIIFNNEQKNITENPLPGINENYKNIALKVAVKRYIFFGTVVILSAIALPFFADHLAEEAGLSKSFVGTLLVAGATSLPELIVSIAAVRIGSMDIAVGNLLGSNIFNMLILAVDDFIYQDGPILSIANPNHALSALVVLLMTAVVGIGILYSSRYKRFGLGLDAMVIIMLYAILMISLYKMG